MPKYYLKKQNPRIEVRPPKNDLMLVFGYEKWKLGDKGDQDTLSRLPESLKTDKFIEDEDKKGKFWPMRHIHKVLYLALA